MRRGTQRLILALVSTFGIALLARQSPIHQGTEPTLKTHTDEILVDFDVRDKRGRFVTDLSQGQVSVFDNGALRPINSFRLIHDLAPKRNRGEQNFDNGLSMRLVTLIFDQMDLNARRMSREAALELLKQDLPPNIYISVFRLNNGLQLIESFTRDRELLRKAIDLATGEPSGNPGRSVDELRQKMDRLLGPDTGNESLEERVGDIKDLGEAALMKVMLGMLRTDERLSLTNQSRNVIFPLLAAVRGQSRLSGRKSVLLFSMGFSVPYELEDEFKATLDAAGRANVTFFTVDARGLESAGANESASEQLKAAAQESLDHATLDKTARETRRTNDPSGMDVMTMEMAENSGRYNTQDTLARLAEATGGFLIANTNDLRSPVRRVLENIETYYELSYSPGIAQYDGSFHKIAVKTSRPDLKIEAKSGYFAIPPSLANHEAPTNFNDFPLGQALDGPTASLSFPFESRALHFRGDMRRQICEIIIDLPLRAVTMEKNPETNKLEGGIKYLVRITDETGATSKTLQGELPLSASDDQLEALRQNEFTDTEEVDLPPGRYTVGVAILDSKSGKTSARKSVIAMPEPSEALSMSSVSLIRSWKPKEPEASEDDPFVFEGKTMTPTLAPIIRRSDSTSLPFYMIVYPKPKNAAKPELVVEFDRDGGAPRRINNPATAVQVAPGRIQYLANFPIEQFEPGTYTVRFIVRQGNETVQESVGLNLE